MTEIETFYSKWSVYPTRAPGAGTVGAVAVEDVVYKMGVMDVSKDEAGDISVKKLEVNPLGIKYDLGDIAIPERGVLISRRPRNPTYKLLTLPANKHVVLYPKPVSEYVITEPAEAISRQFEKVEREDQDINRVTGTVQLDELSLVLPSRGVVDPAYPEYEGEVEKVIEMPMPPDDSGYEGDVRFGSYISFSEMVTTKGYLSSMGRETFKLIDPKSGRKSGAIPYDATKIKVLKPSTGARTITIANGASVKVGKDGRSWADIQDSAFAPGTLVRIRYTDATSARAGVVLGFTDEGFLVSVPDQQDLVKVSYGNKSVKIIPRETVYNLNTSSSIKLFTTLLNSPPTDELRKLVIDTLYGKFADVIPAVEEYISPELRADLTDGELATLRLGIKVWKRSNLRWEPTTASGSSSSSEARNTIQGVWIVRWKLPSGKYMERRFEVYDTADIDSVKEIAEAFMQDAYYPGEVLKWYRTRMAVSISGNLPLDRIHTKAERAIARKTSPTAIIEELKARYGELFFHTDAETMYLRMRDAEGKDDLDHDVLGEIELIQPEDRLTVSGMELARILVRPIAKYIRRHSNEHALNSEVERLKRAWFDGKLAGASPNKKERAIFEKRYGAEVMALYNEFVVNYDAVLAKASSIEKAKSLSSKQPQSTAAIDVREQVVEYESRMYEKYPEKVSTYLKNVLTPLVFLEGETGKRARFFRAKLEKGVFEIRSLGSATLAHYFPELLMNYKVLGPRIATALGAITTLLYSKMMNFISMYSHYLNYRTYIQLPPLDPIVWSDYTVSVLEECKRTGAMKGGLVARDEDGNIIYESIIEGDLEIVRPKEDLADLTICYDEELSSFTCHDTTSILHDIKYGKGINPVTGRPYPKKFAKRFVKRRRTEYDMLKPGSFDPVSVRPFAVDPNIEALFMEPSFMIEEVEEESEAKAPVTGLFKKYRVKGAFPNLEGMSIRRLEKFILKGDAEVPRRVGGTDAMYKRRLIEYILSAPGLLTGYTTIPPLETMKPGTIRQWMKLEGIDIPEGTGKIVRRGGVGTMKRGVTRDDLVKAIVTAKFGGLMTSEIEEQDDELAAEEEIEEWEGADIENNDDEEEF